MKNLVTGKSFLVLMGFFMLLLAIGCGGMQPGAGLNDEAATGDESGEFGELKTGEGENSAVQSDEDEVLALLGITRDEKKPQPPVVKETPENGSTASTKITDLENVISKRDSELMTLRSDLQSKQERINELEARLSQPKTSIPGLTPIPPAAQSDYKIRYDSALQLYYSRKYNEAITEFEGLLATDMAHSLSDNAQYWIGECYYGMRNYNQAVIEFEKVFSFSRNDKYDDATLKIGLCYMKLGENEKARAEFERLISDYPKSEYISKAEYYLSNL